ncbi:MAG: alpha/beta fold hydrolase [Propionibacteriaceae bacterium]
MLRSLMSSPSEVPIWSRLGEIAVPVLVITGDHDHNVDPARTAQVAGSIPGTRLLPSARRRLPQPVRPHPARLFGRGTDC